MGSDKTTVGPLVANQLGWRFVDVDDVIEAEVGVKITEIFARQGEEVFREREHETIARLADIFDDADNFAERIIAVVPDALP